MIWIPRVESLNIPGAENLTATKSPTEPMIERSVNAASPVASVVTGFVPRTFSDGAPWPEMKIASAVTCCPSTFRM